MKTYSTSEIAGIMGLHPNTIMLYEKWGYIAPVERRENGYRVYNETHLEQLKLVRMALRSDWVKYYMRFETRDIIRCAAQGDLTRALELCMEYLTHIQNEMKNELSIIKAIQEILKSDSPEEKNISLTRNEASKLVGVSINVIVNWERYGLIEVPRSNNGYRAYGEAEIKLLRIIKALRQESYRTHCIGKMLERLNIKSKKTVVLLSEGAEDTYDWLQSFMSDAENDAKDLVSYIVELTNKRTNSKEVYYEE